jgi:glycosyltransferase involved in cell wall biosynthesis
MYIQLRAKVFKEHFDVTIFDLKTSTRMKPREPSQIKNADDFIDSVAAELPNYDVVDIDCELGLWGSTLEEIEARIIKCCKASRKLIFTMHRLDASAEIERPFSLAYARLLKSIRNRDNDHPYFIFVHTNKETRMLNDFHGLKNVMEHPVCFLDESEKQHFLDTANPKQWKKDNGFAEDDIIIGRFGTITPHKDHRAAIRALEYLPDNYKMAFIGGAQPYSIKPFAIDPNISDLLEFLEERKRQGNDIAKRIRFFGIVDNDVFYKAMANIDFVVIPHYEAGQSASAVTSVALEFGQKVITTYNFTFKEYQRYYPNCFEMFDIGNYFELRDKILHFDTNIRNNAIVARNKYTANTLARAYKELYDRMCSNNYVNDYEPKKLEQLLSTLAIPVVINEQGAKIQTSLDKIKQLCPVILRKPLRAILRKPFKAVRSLKLVMAQ